MSRESVTLRVAEGDGRSRASADVTQVDATLRAVKAGLFIAGGILGGAACIIVPVLHLVTTWALPLLGILAGVRALKVRAVVREISGPCPSCGRPLELPGGTLANEPLRGECPACRAGILVEEA